MLDVVREAAGAAAVLLAARRRDPVGAYVLGRTAAGACALLFSYRRLATATISSKSRWQRSAATETPPRDSEMKVRIETPFRRLRVAPGTSRESGRRGQLSNQSTRRGLGIYRRAARLGHALAGRAARAWRRRRPPTASNPAPSADRHGRRDRRLAEVSSRVGQCLFYWPEAKARTSSTGTTSALAELRVGGAVRKSA